MGSGPFCYRAVEWGRLPDGWSVGDVGGIGVDSDDRVYVFNRSSHPMLVFDRHGSFLRSWGEGIFTRPHGIHIDPEGFIYCTDDGDHTVRKCTPQGEVVLELGIPKQGAPYMSGLPFHRCTHTAVSPDGDIYVSDGYGNARIHKFSGSGKLLKSWGEPGIGPGEFNIPHNLCCDAAGWVYVADRENHRVQVFDGDGRFETQWNYLHRPCALCCQSGPEALFFVGEISPSLAVNRLVPNLGPRVSVVTQSGEIIARIGQEGPGVALGQFIAPHGMAVDSHGDLYVGEVSHAAWPQLFPDTPIPPERLRTLRKLVKVPSS